MQISLSSFVFIVSVSSRLSGSPVMAPVADKSAAIRNLDFARKGGQEKIGDADIPYPKRPRINIMSSPFM
jgi:hypothetical protein